MSLVPVDETYSKHGAGRFASAIKKHWLDQGYHSIRTEVVPVPGVPKHWTVTSNIDGTGYPPRA